jgi:hypothetical protein
MVFPNIFSLLNAGVGAEVFNLCTRNKWEIMRYKILYSNFVSANNIVQLYYMRHYR